MATVASSPLTLANVLYEKKAAIAYVTVNRPNVLNALNTPTWADLRTAFEDARDDDAIRGVILTGSGNKAFIAGADISELAQATPLIYADITGFGSKGPDADLPGFDITSYWARSGLLSMARVVGLYSAIVTALYRRERTGKGFWVTTSFLAEGVWLASASIQAALCEAKFHDPHDRKNPANAALNVYRASDGVWFVLIVTSDKLAAVMKALDRDDLLADPRFSDPATLARNRPQLTAILDELFGSQPMSHWSEVFSGVHVTFGAVRGPEEVINDPQLRANDIVVPLEGAGSRLNWTISSPMQVQGVGKIAAKRAPELGEHSQEVLEQIGFSAAEIDGLLANGVVLQ